MNELLTPSGINVIPQYPNFVLCSDNSSENISSAITAWSHQLPRCALPGPAIKLYIWPNGPSAACADCAHLFSVAVTVAVDAPLCTQSNV
ncbi:hypothetical protein ACLKA6_000909 [Drosophila palustris]